MEWNPVLLEDVRRVRKDAPVLASLEGTTVVVTGCAGFLGFELMHVLAGIDGGPAPRKVIGLDTFHLERPAWVDRLERAFPDRVSIVRHDIVGDDLADVAGTAEADYVIHGASIASPVFYRQYPVITLDANVWGLRKLLDFYRSRPLKGLLFFSTSEIYGDPPADRIPTDEEYRGNVATMGPRACYDEAKRFCETMCWVFAREYGTPITIVRPFNNYGPGMRLNDGRAPADFAKAVLDGEDIVILSDGSPKRTFCYVADAIGGYVQALGYGKLDVFNIGVEDPEIRVSELAECFRDAGRQILGYRGEVRLGKAPEPDFLTHNPQRRCPIIDKARRVLDYRPSIRVDEGVRRWLRFLDAERDAED